MDKLNLPKDEMAIRRIYQDLVERRKLTTVFRPGRRICGDFRGYCPGDKVKLKIIDKVGADWAMLPPSFVPNFEKIIKITQVESFPLKDLQAEHFLGSSPDVCNKETLIYHLGIIYNLDPASFNDNTVITRVNFEYI